MTTDRQNNLLGDLIDGAIAGAIATWVMGEATTYRYEREAEDQARGDSGPMTVGRWHQGRG